MAGLDRRGRGLRGDLVFALVGFSFLTIGLGYSPTLAGGLLTMMVILARVRSGVGDLLRLGTASGIVNMSGFTAALVTIFAVGLILDVRAPLGNFGLADFKVAFCFQDLLWGFGLVSVIRSRRLTRAGMRAEGTIVDPAAQRDRPALARAGPRLGGRGGPDERIRRALVRLL